MNLRVWHIDISVRSLNITLYEQYVVWSKILLFFRITFRQFADLRQMLR